MKRTAWKDVMTEGMPLLESTPWQGHPPAAATWQHEGNTLAVQCKASGRHIPRAEMPGVVWCGVVWCGVR